MPADPLKAAVVTGGHPFDVAGFAGLLRSLPGVDPYLQHLEDFASAPEEVRRGYDTVVLYCFPQATPADEGRPWYEGKPRSAMASLGRDGRGIVVLHHALLAYPEWDLWTELTGLPRRKIFSYHFAQKVRVAVADPGHPVTAGLKDWELTDETYVTDEPDSGSRLLLTTEHSPSLRALAWTRDFRGARTFCYQSGHDAQAWNDPGFREVLRRGIHWSAGREP